MMRIKLWCELMSNHTQRFITAKKSPYTRKGSVLQTAPYIAFCDIRVNIIRYKDNNYQLTGALYLEQ